MLDVSADTGIEAAQHRLWGGGWRAQTFMGDSGSETPTEGSPRRRVAPFISSDAVGNDTAQRQ